MSRKTMSKKAKIILISVISFVLIIGSVLYALADRYLIEHVEVLVDTTTQVTTAQVSDSQTASTRTDSTLAESTQTESTQTESTQSSSTQSASTSSSNSSSGSSSINSSAATTTSSTTAENNSAAYTADSTSYKSSTKEITIKKVVTGSGSNTVTYYVADIILKNATDLTSAFAKNAYGTNIIEYTSTIASNNNAILAINGDYYGFRNNGIIIRNGVIYRDSPARTGLAFYSDGTMKIYDETKTTAQKLLDAGVINTYSFGPALLNNSIIPDNVESYQVDTNIGNHPIQGYQPRTGIGMISNNHFVFVVVDGRSTGYSKGVTLTEFAQIFKSLGCTTAYNMDGGGSSTMYFMGDLVNNPLGKNQERGTSDIIYIK